MDICPAGKENVEEILRLCAKLWREHQEIDPSFKLRPDIQSIQRRWLREATGSRYALVLVAKADGRVVATATGSVSKSSIFWPENFGNIRDVYVEADYRRKGIGTAMTEKLVAWLKQKRISWVELAALTKNEQADRFWRDHGFTPIFNIYRRELEDEGTV